MSSAKTVEPIEMPFGSRLVWANKEPYIRWGIIGATWLIRWIGLCGGGDAACRYHYCIDFFTFSTAIFFIL